MLAGEYTMSMNILTKIGVCVVCVCGNPPPCTATLTESQRVCRPRKLVHYTTISAECRIFILLTSLIIKFFIFVHFITLLY